MAKFDLVSMGELLIDFTPVGISENGNPIFERNPGGGPANMVCAAQKLGAKTAFAGKVGNDMFGTALKAFLTQQNVDTHALLLDSKHPTSLAFVQLDKNGDRAFSFYRKHSADTMLTFSELPKDILDTRLFFCSSVLMAEGSSRQASFDALQAAHSAGIPVVFDPNLRFNLWDSADDLRDCVLRALPYASIVKVAEDELCFLLQQDSGEKAVQVFQQRFSQCHALLITRGKEGCVAYVEGHRYVQRASLHRAADATAAGDSFTGGFVAALLHSGKSLASCSPAEVQEMLRYASAVGGITASRKGSICSLPTLEEVTAVLAEDW